MAKKNVDKLKARLKTTLNEISREVDREFQANLSEADLFTFWFLRCEVVKTPEQAYTAVTNGPNDKSCDAIFVDPSAKIVWVVQTKCHMKAFARSPVKSATLLECVDLCRKLRSASDEDFKSFVATANSTVKKLLRSARRKIKEDGYLLRMFFVTTGTCSQDLIAATNRSLKRYADHEIQFNVVTHKDVPYLLMDYEDHVRPAIPRMEIPIEHTSNLRLESFLYRIDQGTELECWVVPVNGRVVGNLYANYGLQLFARNVRGYMGDNAPVNRKMLKTLRNEPAMFIHYNNGITMVCDTVEVVSREGLNTLIAKHPQIINGQQTTRSLDAGDNSGNASVLLKVIKLKTRYSDNSTQFHKLIGKIVNATNSQTPVKSSDLVSNDQTQLNIESALKKKGFLYLRKREALQEATARFGPGKRNRFIKKLDLAKAVASCEFDQRVVRSGVEHLFEGQRYKDVFPNSSPYYYLTRYFLWKRVSKASRKRSAWSYARAMVVYYVWKHVNKLLINASAEENFVDKLFGGELQTTKAVAKLAEATFIEAHKFYRRNCGSGDSVVDISQFYRNKRGRNKEFEQERSQWSATSKRKFSVGLATLRKALKTKHHRTSKVMDGV